MKISKKLSVLAGTAGVWFLQQQGIDPTEMVNQVIITPLGDMAEQATQSSDKIIYYLSGIYIAVQGLIDTVTAWVSKDGNNDAEVARDPLPDTSRV